MTKADAELPEREKQPALENIRQAQTVVGELFVVVHKDKAGYQFRRQPIGKTGEQTAQMGW